ncbi:MAG: TerB family tellurite resistance protein [Pseudomonadales bacterium]|nr:TerB family tellurite resistance protein [Pseudomonadales bacterium]
MLNSIKNFFESKLAHTEEENQSSVQKIDLASAALLIEVIKSDHELDARETAEFLEVMRESLDVSEEELNELVELAETEAQQATSLFEFTRLINDEYDYEEKVRLIENMWRIAFSDEQLDKYEEHLIRKISDLIYVSHSDFIKSKLKVRND